MGALLGVATAVVSVHARASVKGEKLSFFRYKIESEAASDWKVHAQIDRGGTSELMGLFTSKSDPAMKLMAFRRDDVGDKICANERSQMNIKKTKYETVKAPKGWSCVYVEKDKSRVTAIKSFFIKGKSRSTPFALVLVGESMPRERFMKALGALKDVP